MDKQVNVRLATPHACAQNSYSFTAEINKINEVCLQRDLNGIDFYQVILFEDADRFVLFLRPRVVRDLTVWVRFGCQEVLYEAIAAWVVNELK